MSKRKAEGVLQRGMHYEDETTEVQLSEDTSNSQIVGIRAEAPAEGGTRGAPATLAAAPSHHVDCEGANLFWALLEDVGYTVW